MDLLFKSAPQAPVSSIRACRWKQRPLSLSTLSQVGVGSNQRHQRKSIFLQLSASLMWPRGKDRPPSSIRLAMICSNCSLISEPLYFFAYIGMGKSQQDKLLIQFMLYFILVFQYLQIFHFHRTRVQSLSTLVTNKLMLLAPSGALIAILPYY